MTRFLKSLLATASLSAVLAGAPAHAANLPCPVDTGLDQCYAGAVLSNSSDIFGEGNFGEWKIGTLSLGSGLWDVAGFFGARGAENLTVNLLSNSIWYTTYDGMGFNNVRGGTYDVLLYGSFTNPGSFFGGQSLAVYAGGFDIKSAVPEPQTYALFLAGLMAVGYVARRRKAE